jgi:peptidoglycan/xylan/chitin deacetylase (PgdA/CDA1 family)
MRARRLLAALAALVALACVPAARSTVPVTIAFGPTTAALPVTIGGVPEAGWKATVTVRDVTGHVVRRWSAAVTATTWSATFPLADLHSGEYHARVSTTDGHARPVVATSRWIVVRHAAGAKVVQRVARAGKRVALTFDDGLDAAAAERMFATLRAAHAPATLFLNASVYARSPRLVRAVRRMLTTGLVTLGNHTADHTWLTRVSDASIRWQILSDQRYVMKTFGRSNLPFFRPPYGAWNARVRRIAGGLGYTDFVLWSVDPSDYKSPPAGRVIASAMAQLSPGAIILMHVNRTTAATLPTIIARLKARGYSIVPLWRLLRG